jgi:hypothetical protein
MKHGKTDGKLFPKIVNLNIFVMSSNGYHFFKNPIAEYGLCRQNGEVCDPVNAPLPIQQLLVLVYQHVLVLEYALVLLDQHRGFCHPKMSLRPLEMALKLLPEAQLFNASHDAQTFPKFSLVLDFESNSEIFHFVIKFLRRIFVLQLDILILFDILISESVFVVDLVFNHFKIVVIQNVGASLDIVCFARRVWRKSVIYFWLWWSNKLLEAVILAKTHPSLLHGLGWFRRRAVALDFEALFFAESYRVLSWKIHL